MSSRVPVTFEPAGITVWVTPGSTALEAARSAGIVLAAPCGGRGVCGSCGVRVLDGELAPPDERELLGMRRGGTSVRLACRARVEGPVTIRPVVLTSGPETGRTDGSMKDLPLVAGVDLGTTTIAAALVDPATGRELARASVPNPQQSHGSDVLSRLSAALEGNADELRVLAEQGISTALQAAAEAAGVTLNGVERLVVVGNTAMSALLEGADTAPLAVHPFAVPAMDDTMTADSLVRKTIASDAAITVLPPVAGFVGGDALAATLAAGMIDADEPTLLVDFGTNAEIVLAGSGSLVVASAAAGPAFEAVGISCGGPAASGAVTRVRVSEDGSVGLDSIGPEAPLWFSGSGLVSAVAALVRLGHIDASGLFHAPGPLAERFRAGADGVLGVDLGDRETGGLVLTQLDVRALQLAKAAVAVGIRAVLSRGSVGAAELVSVLIAGAFGTAMEPDDLITLGVLPAGVAGRTHRVGNAALDGAAIVALDPGVFELAVGAAASAIHVDLALDAGFVAALMRATEFAPYSI